ncbi:MAG TPA: DUF2480 family protein [Cyclobacteriaceae bacterium]|jgi:hypothetical protein
MEEKEIVNRVAASGLKTFDLEELYRPGERVNLDIRDQLYEGLILREKDFRGWVKEHPWTDFAGKFVAVNCSADAIVPTWAFMLLGVALQPYAEKVVYGSLEDLERVLFQEALSHVDWESYRDAKVVVKGCSRVNVPVEAYVEVVARLRPLAASIMYGEPCSTVPLFKRPK